MNIDSISGSVPTKRVVVSNTPADATDEQILDFVLTELNESRPRLFGWTVSRGASRSLVTLHTD